MPTIAVSGSGSGMGAAIRQRCERDGHSVIGIDLRRAEIIADLGTAAGRAAALTEVRRRADGRLDGLVACAGVATHIEPRSTIVSVNYFGAQALMAGLRDLLAAGSQPAAVAIGSNSAPFPGMDTPMVSACLAGDEDEARRIAMTLDGSSVYAGSKLALTRWVRRNAPTADWAGAGIRLNAVAPGATMTPMLQAGLDHPDYGEAIRNFKVPLGGFGTPEQIAATVGFLLGPEAAFCCGSVVFVDGGTDAMFRPNSF
ncbi:MAG: SDR family oxidoreductase [Candidatus Binatia bacterium]